MVALMIASLAFGSVGLADAKNEGGPKAYKSGYSHGCDDVGLPEDEKYINQPEKGPRYHSQDFMDGYYNGYSTCKEAGVATTDYSEVNTAVDDSFNNRDSVVQPQSQSANTVQSAGCPQQLINGDCYIGQEQAVKNDFAQANRADN